MELEKVLGKRVPRRGFLKIVAVGTPVFMASEALASGGSGNSENNHDEAFNRKSLDFLAAHKKTIEEESEKNGLPAAFVASVLMTEMSDRLLVEGVGDRINSWFNADGTYGPGQMKLSTALFLDGKIRNETEIGKIPGSIKSEYINNLNDPDTNIAYVARYLSYLKNRSNRFENISPENFIKDPNALAIIATEYQIGPKDTKKEEARFNKYGVYIADGLSSISKVTDIFPINASTRQLYDEFREDHLDYLTKEDDEIPHSRWVMMGKCYIGIAALFGAYFGIKHLIKRKEKIKNNETRNFIGMDLK